MPAVNAADEWDWSRRILDHVDLHAGDFGASGHFHETVLASRRRRSAERFAHAVEL